MLASRKQLKNANKGLFIIILTIGLVIGTFIFISLAEYNFYKNADKVIGEINDITVSTHRGRRGTRTTTYRYYINYTTADGQKYNNVLAKYNGGLRGTNYSKGTPVIVYYNKSNPREIGLVGYSANITSIVILVVFGIIAIFVLGGVFKNLKRLKLINFLINNGIRDTAVITNIETIRGRKGYVISCSAVNPLNGQQIFASCTVPTIKNLGIGINYQLNAYFDPQEPEIYFIDLG